MDRAQYTGTEYPELVGKVALIRAHPEDENLVLAQFDDVGLVNSELPHSSDAFEERHWGFGWHELPKLDMPLVVDIRIRIGSL